MITGAHFTLYSGDADADPTGAALYLMGDDVAAEVERLGAAGVACQPLRRAEWGISTPISLPSGGRIGLYQPQHPSPLQP